MKCLEVFYNPDEAAEFLFDLIEDGYDVDEIETAEDYDDEDNLCFLVWYLPKAM